MRIAYVTAHLPPDIATGATLIVDRLAREMTRRGHDVEVFSGALHQGLADGEVRIDAPADDRPYTIRWVGTTPTTVFEDNDRNWDNPAAAVAVAEWLRSFEPDVVHLHALQTLGASVVETAADAARAGSWTVVTMHDLWWWCARLFLVDTEIRPCPMVTSIDICACARSSTWRRQRAERLSRALERVDQILAPSSALRDVIIANGIDPARVEVDENHVADSVFAQATRLTSRFEDGPASTVTPRRDAVRFLYVGGNSPLKGAEVVRAAARRLDADTTIDRSRWQLTAYGLEGDEQLPPSLVTLPAFPADDVVEVMTGHDVFIQASIARESFSLTAREALAAGLPVITADCLGPQEVVHHDDNGIVIPTDDADALAAAMASLIIDRQRLARLTAAVCTRPVPLRSLADHADALVAIYSRRMQRGSQNTASGRERTAQHDPQRIGVVVGLDGEAARWRAHHLRDAIATGAAAEPGPLAHHLDPGLVDRMAGCEVVVVQQAPATPSMLAAIETWRAAGALVVVDLSDAARGSAPGLHELAGAIEICDGILAADEWSADQVAASCDTPTIVVRDMAGRVELQLAELARRAHRPNGDNGTVRIGFRGDAASSQQDLDLLAPELLGLMRRHPQVELVVMGDLALPAVLAQLEARVSMLPLPAWRDLSDHLIGLDINLAPAPIAASGDDRTVRSWLEASLVEVPCVTSTSATASHVIEHGRTGMLGDSPAGLAHALETMVTDRSLRTRLGAAARRAVELHHGPHIAARRYSDAFETFALDRSSRPSSTPNPQIVRGVVGTAPSDASAGTGSVVEISSYDLGDRVLPDIVIPAQVIPRRSLLRRITARLRAIVQRLLGHRSR